MYSGVWDALSSVYSAGGVQGLFVGAAARFAWLLPFTMIYLPVYEIAKRNIVRLRKPTKN
jgi:Mitochondrial carrier protein